MGWRERLTKTPRGIRRQLDLESVLSSELGLVFNRSGYALCPAHTDTRPSLRVFRNRDDLQVAGCWSCDWRADVFDVLQLTQGMTFGEALEYAHTLIGQLPPPPTPEAPFELELDDLRASLVASAERASLDLAPIHRLIVAKGLRCSPEWLRDYWQVGVASTAGQGVVFVPHFNASGVMTGYKTRSPRSQLIGAYGSKFPDLYGAWLYPKGYERTILCEGESDTWTASWFFRDDPAVGVVGLPTGVGTPARSHWIDMIEDSEVVIIFDADDAGARGVQKWENALTKRNVAHSVRGLPQGYDLTRLTGMALERVLR